MMQVTLCLLITFAAALDGISGIPVYNKFGIYTKKFYNNFHQGQNPGFNIGLSSAIPKNLITNKGYFKYPNKNKFVYNTGYIGQHIQPVGKRIILNNLPAENVVNNAHLVRVVYPYVGNPQTRDFNVFNDNPNVNVVAGSPYIQQNIGNIVQSNNVIQEDLRNTYKSATDYSSTKLEDFHGKTTYIKANEPEVLRIVRSNIDVADGNINGDYVAGDGTVYKVLPEDENQRYQTLYPGARLDETRIGTTDQFQIIKSIEPVSTYSTTGFGVDNQVQIIDQPVTLNTGEVVLQQLNANIPQSEILKLFS